MANARLNLCLVSAFCACLAPAEARAVDLLPSFRADLGQTSVSGISSGAYMAGQFHVAFSASVVGVGIIAGGPYGCSEGMISMALARCMATDWGAPRAAALAERARKLAEAGRIDPIKGLLGDRIYVFSGTEDPTVTPPVAAQVAPFYRLAGVQSEAIAVVDDMPAGHAFVTAGFGSSCGATASPFVNDCDYDQAGALLTHIHGTLEPPAAEPAGTLLAFEQREFVSDAAGFGMAATGYAYIPESCAEGGCIVHVAFHGCRQTKALIGDAFIEGAGYNRWADTNRMIVLYPQAAETTDNPNACWDWWGYTRADFAEQSGPQLAAVHAMLDRLAGTTEPAPSFCQTHTARNSVHWREGRARPCDGVFLCAVGSGDPLGLMVTVSTLYERPRGSYATTSCPG